MIDKYYCPVCESACALLDVVDFNKSCVTFLPLSGIPIYYSRCGHCGFCFAPTMYGWLLNDFAERVYNDEYVKVDPDYIDARPRKNSQLLLKLFNGFPATHMDYGGGNGMLSELLKESGWYSASYDPFINPPSTLSELGRFDLITAFEVFEHVPDVNQLMSTLQALSQPNALVLFSTLLSDGNIEVGQRLSWWYASPRNGHISLFSRKSLQLLADKNGLNFGSLSNGLHIFFKNTPPPVWAAHIIKKA